MKHSTNTRPHVKERYPSVFRALQADARNYQGGVPELAEQMGRNYGSLRNALNPTNTAAEPTLEAALETIELTGGERTAQAIARLAGMTALPIPEQSHGTPREVAAAFMSVVKSAGRVNDRTADALEDGRLDAGEREEVGSLLDKLIAAAVELRALVRG